MIKLKTISWLTQKLSRYDPQHDFELIQSDKLRWLRTWLSRIVSVVPSRKCIVRASIASSYSHRATTRCAIYSKTWATPSPVFADVKNSFGRRSGWVIESVLPAEHASLSTGVGGVIIAVADARLRRKSEGVIVGVDDDDEADVILRAWRFAGDNERSTIDWWGDKAGDDWADSYSSKREDEGVWYMVFVVFVDVIVPPNWERSDERDWETRLLILANGCKLDVLFWMEIDCDLKGDSGSGASSSTDVEDSDEGIIIVPFAWTFEWTSFNSSSSVTNGSSSSSDASITPSPTTAVRGTSSSRKRCASVSVTIFEEAFWEAPLPLSPTSGISVLFPTTTQQ